ncbi:Cleft lip and palate transmembrane protein 1 like protein [Trapelia coarctata]|nr:Cleft lip and palate transmembrane protein 1 like protein [Trapelia coarctata]
MPERVAPAGAPAREPEAAAGSTIKNIIQAVAIFAIAQFAVNAFVGSKNKASVPETPSFNAKPDSTVVPGEYNPIPQSIAPIWPLNSSLDISIYVSPSLIMPSLDRAPAQSLILEEKGFTMGDWKDKRVIDTSFPMPKEAQQNGTLQAHFYVALHGHALDPTAADYNVATAYHFVRPLNQVLAKKKVVKTKRLLGSSNSTEDDTEPAPSGPVWASYYHPNFTMSFIPDSGYQSYVNMHPAVRSHVTLEATGARDKTGQNGWYYPVLYVNTFWQLRDHMIELNNTIKTLPIHITLNNLNNWKFALYASIDESVKTNQRNIAAGGPVTAQGDGSEFEEFKRVLIDTNIYLLSTTVIVSVLHMIFEMLAFKSDISHWRHKKDNVGISVRTILANVLMQTIIFLYLLDNSDGTSWMILFGQGMGILIEAWKITKTVDVRIRDAAPDSWLPYRLSFEDKHKLSETEKKTQEYDQIAFRYLYMVAVPLLGAYAVYSVLYESHKSWYSFVITTLVGSVYAYGFLMMVPSLYINYRLKSVAHMPARAMTYKFLNTFIDDLFAFTIKMPTLHRLATLRDDVIFFFYLYQSWAYKVDYSRVNEFGQGGEEEEAEDKVANKPLSAPADADAGVDADVRARVEAKMVGVEKGVKEGVKEGKAKATGAEKGKAVKRR